MTLAEQTEWAAFEQTNGPLSVGERIDFGFARLTYTMASLWSKQPGKPEDYLPPWYDTRRVHDPLEGFKRMLERAEEREHADNQHPDR